MIKLISFGYRYGKPQCDHVFDMRSVPNPYNVPSLQELDGTSPEVQAWLECRGDYRSMVERILSVFFSARTTYPLGALTIGIGCAGGKHRSVAMVERLRKELKEFDIEIEHRDLGRW